MNNLVYFGIILAGAVIVIVSWAVGIIQAGPIIVIVFWAIENNLVNFWLGL